jgi:cytochrome c55X
MTKPAVLIAALLGAAPTLLTAAAPLSEQRVDELRYLVRQDCGSCHGMTMRGGLGPPLTPEALDGKPSELLAVTIRDGRAGTAMPPWRKFLSDEEIAWIVNELTEGSLNQ